MNDLETLAARARLAKKRLLKHGAPSVGVVVTYYGHSPDDPNECGMAIEIKVGPYLGVAALEALADELDRKLLAGDDKPFNTEGMRDA